MARESGSVLRKDIVKVALSIPLLLLTAGASFTTSKADDWHGSHVRSYGQWKHSYPVAYSTVPRWIPTDYRATYHPYFSGQVYYGPHRHYHTVYQFPVFVNGAVVYRPYPYCGDQIFVSAGVPLPRLAFNVVLGAPAPVFGYPWYPPGIFFYYHHGDRDGD